MWKIDSEGNLIGSPNIKKSIVCCNYNMSYEDAQQIIHQSASLELSDLQDNQKIITIMKLHQIAEKLRWNRQREGKCNIQIDDGRPFCTEPCIEAHRLVEEFMIQANRDVAAFLSSHFSGNVPFRHQMAPDIDDVNNWLENNRETAMSSFYFRQFGELLNGGDDLHEKIYDRQMGKNHGSKNIQSDAHDESEPESENDSFFDVPTNHNLVQEMKPVLQGIESINLINEACNPSPSSVPILVTTLNDLKSAADSLNLSKVTSLVGCEDLHPQHNLAMIRWFYIQNSAEVVINSHALSHYTLQLPTYVQFTSPIRRFTDLVIHRFVKAALDDSEAPYSEHDMNGIFERINRITAGGYSRACKLLKTTTLFRAPFFLPCFVQEFDHDGILLTSPYLRGLKRGTRNLKYSLLSVSEMPRLVDSKVNISFYFILPKICY